MESERNPPLPPEAEVAQSSDRPPLPPDSMPQLSSKRWAIENGERSQYNSSTPVKRRRINAEDDGESNVSDSVKEGLASNENSGKRNEKRMDFEDLSSDDEGAVLGLEDGEIDDEELSAKSTQSSTTKASESAVIAQEGPAEEPEDVPVQPKFFSVNTHQGPPPADEALPEVRRMLEDEEDERRRQEAERAEEERLKQAALQNGPGGCYARDEGFKQEFIIIDDIEGSDNEKEGDEASTADRDEAKQGTDIGADVYDSDYIDEDEIEALLDENLQKKKTQELDGQDYFIREKTVLVDRGRNPFDILPEGWVQVFHHSGIPVYLHKKMRVCTVSRPYFLGTGSVRRHNIPLSAIPCLQYKRILEEEQAEKANKDQTTEEQSAEISQSDSVLQQSKMETNQSETSEQNDQNANSASANVSNENPSVQREGDMDQGAAMLSKLQEDLHELNALAQGSTPGTPRTPSPVTEDQPQGATTDNQPTLAPSAVSTENQPDEPESAISAEKAEEIDASQTSGDSNDPERLKTILAGKLAKKGVCPVTNASQPKVSSIEEHKANQTLDADQVLEYCENLFEFKKIQVKRFKSWGARHKHRRAEMAAYRDAHQLPSGTQILTCDVMPQEDKGGGSGSRGKRKKEFVLNLKGKNDVCILHEYAQHVIRVKPTYEYKETTNAEKPFLTTITINGIVYGTGSAASKKLAKAAAARDALNVLIPEVAKMRAGEKGGRSDIKNEYAFFDEIKIEDPRILELSARAGQPLPFNILQECLKRNFGMGDTNIVMDMHIIRPQRSQFTMKVAQYEGKVMCKNKKEGKHMAAQQILQKMHPHVKSWGSILRMYARDIEALKLKQVSKEAVSQLQSKANLKPNLLILSKLKEQMFKIHTVRKEVEASVRGHLEMPSLVLRSRLHLEDLNLTPQASK